MKAPPPDLLIQPVLARIAGGADRNVELAAVGARQDVARPVIVVAAGRQRKDHLARRLDPGLALLVGEAHHAIGVRDEERVPDQCHAKGLVQVLQEDGTCLRHSVPIRIAQERDPVRAYPDRAGPNHALTFGRGLVGFRVTSYFSNEHVAVGQHVQPARALQAAREGKVTLNPSGAVGVRPSGQPMMRENFATDAARSGYGSLGLGSMPGISTEGCWASAGPVSAKTANRTIRDVMTRMIRLHRPALGSRAIPSQ